MLVTPLLCLALCSQVSEGRPNKLPIPETKPKPDSRYSQATKQPPPPVQAGSRLGIARSYVSTNMTGLNLLAYLTYYDRGTAENRKAVIEEMAKAGLVVGLERTTRIIVKAVAVATDPTSDRPVSIYYGRLLDGPSRDGLVYLFEHQVEDPAAIEPPRPYDDDARKVYRKFRKAINDAHSRATEFNWSIRKSVIERKSAENVREMCKELGLMLGEVEDVQRLGELDDGRTAKKAEAVVRANLRAQNSAMLSVLDRQINAQLSEVLKRAQAQASARGYFPPGPGLVNVGPGVIINGPLGHPLNHMTFNDGGASVRPMGK